MSTNINFISIHELMEQLQDPALNDYLSFPLQHLVCLSVREYLLRACFVESAVPRTKSHFSSPDRAVLGQNAERGLTGHVQPGSVLNAPYPPCTSLLNTLNVAPRQCIKYLQAFSEMSFLFLSLKLRHCTYVANS